MISRTLSPWKLKLYTHYTIPHVPSPPQFFVSESDYFRYIDFFSCCQLIKIYTISVWLPIYNSLWSSVITQSTSKFQECKSQWLKHRYDTNTKVKDKLQGSEILSLSLFVLWEKTKPVRYALHEFLPCLLDARTTWGSLPECLWDWKSQECKMYHIPHASL